MYPVVFLGTEILRVIQDFHLLQSLELCQCCANLGLPVVAANGWEAMKAIVRRNLSSRRSARRRIEVFAWTIDDQTQGKQRTRV